MQNDNEPKTLIESTPEEATAVACELIKTIMCDAVDKRGACYMALAGGTTPHLLYKELARSCASGEVPWGQVQVFFGDERDVSQDDVESNYHMAQTTLLDNVPIQPANVHPMPADNVNLAAAADEYEQDVRQSVPNSDQSNIPQFDLILLGMGGDGHTCSLFPGTESLAEDKKLITAYYVPVLGRNRMTFTFPLINAARCIVLLVTGQDKAEVVSKLLSDDPEATAGIPAGQIDPEGTFMIVLDSAAARIAKAKAH